MVEAIVGVGAFIITLIIIALTVIVFWEFVVAMFALGVIIWVLIYIWGLIQSRDK